MGLFNKKKKDAGSNPYAQDGAQVPYANPLTPYQQARNNMAQGQPVGLPSGPRMGAGAANAPSSSSVMSGNSSRFGDDKYGSSNGYGSDRYGSSTSSVPAPGGYGGFDDAGKNDLFAGAGARYVPPQPNNANGPSPAAQAPGPNRNPALFGNSHERYNPYEASRPQEPAADDEYGGYGAPRELTGRSTISQTVWVSNANAAQRRRNRNKNLKTQEPRPKHCERRILLSLIASTPQLITDLTWPSVRDSGLRNKKSVCTIRTSRELRLNLAPCQTLVGPNKSDNAC